MPRWIDEAFAGPPFGMEDEPSTEERDNETCGLDCAPVSQDGR